MQSNKKGKEEKNVFMTSVSSWKMDMEDSGFLKANEYSGILSLMLLFVPFSFKQIQE